ncbi:adenosine nucleotide hydrolase [Chromobacterium sp. LK1]|uniref:Dph6-related ATP pyrophosphatase n=1 Tax=Chromobacterium sp. LK1 TaxID=1628193 RepID=UPI00065337D3|nr:diphthine--ammonia ligase [Chromobacterium sp. LK1]KMN30793.1 adenosine nucleotide hydrolase [Chromobacterium sp. LK1]
MAGRRVLASWSGGKDSCLALWRAVSAGASTQGLLTMMDEHGQRSRSHGVRPEVLALQAAALGLPLRVGRASWDGYEAEFIARLGEARADGCEAVVFGDIDLDAHREWEEKVCAAAGVQAWLPLWQQPRAQLVREFIDAGFSARIVVVNTRLADAQWLGCELSHEVVERMLAAGLDPCAEAGEFHSLATAGPLFARPLSLRDGGIHRHGDYVSLDLLPG